MLFSILGYLFFLVGFLVLALPLILIELSRPLDWLIGGIFLFLGLFLFVENDILIGSIKLFIFSLVILLGKMISEIAQTRWHQLSVDEKNRIGSFERWFESFKQLSQILFLLLNNFLNFVKSLTVKPDKSSKEKKWVRPESKNKNQAKTSDLLATSDSNKIRNEKLTENEETS